VSRGLGEPVTAAGFGPVMVLGAYFVCAQRLSWEALYASLPVAILIALVLYVNEIPDRIGDEKAGKRTLPVRWPPGRVVAAYAIAVVTAFALVPVGVVAGIMPAWTLITLLAAPLGYKAYVGIRDFYGQPYALMGPMQTNIGLHLGAGLLLVAGYVVATLLA
jgi:1,4-dihydroxy-2-naphthoate polyprenyltransferase